MLKTMYNWMGNKVYSKYATLALGFLFFLEAIFFLPTDPMLIFYCIERRDKALYYALIATVGSVLGGITSYFIGYWLLIVAKDRLFHSWAAGYYMSFCSLYERYQNWAIFLAGFTPIPYKFATLSAGFCKLPLGPFIILSFLSRGARFFLYALVIRFWGEQMKEVIDRYFTAIAIVAVVLVVGGIWWISRN